MIAWLALFALVALTLLFLANITRVREQLIEDAADRASEQSMLLADHAARLFEAAELAMLVAADETDALNGARAARSKVFAARVARLARRLPYVEALWLYDAQGILRLSSMAFPAPPNSVADRDFFIRLREAPPGQAHVGDPVGDSFRLSRRLESDGGAFRGVASATVALGLFRRFYGELTLPAGSVVTLLRSEDLRPLVQSPQNGAEAVIHDLGHLRHFLAIAPEGGRFQAVLPLDRIERVYAYRAVPGFPLVIKVSVPLLTVQDEWMRRVAARSLLAFAAMAALGWLTWQAFRQSRRQQLFQSRLEMRVAERTAALERANAQLEELVHEVHHRVNNNLQIVGSLLALQMARLSDPHVRSALAQTTGRVHALSLLHQTMYGAGDVADLAFGDYLIRLARQMEDIHGEHPVHVMVAGANPRLGLDVAVPVALIVHEILANVLSHAFPGGRQGVVRISLEADDPGRWRLTIVDNGIGLPAGFDWRDSRNLGLEIVRRLSAQVAGEASMEAADRGTRFTLVFAAGG